MNNKNLLVIMIFFVVIFNSIVYSALNSEMFINGDAHIRVDKDIRITNVKVLEQVNGSYETYNSDYSKNTTSMQVTLPSSESFMVYEVTITNKGDTDYEVTNIVEESYSNSNIKYELIDIDKGTIIDGGTIHTFKIKFTTTENNLDNKTILVLKYDFKEWIPSLYKMVAHKSRDLDTDIDFGVAPTKETSGVYEMDSTKDDEYPVYYYRGIVDNNNVNFAGFCWKVVRTTSTGGVKLIYNGVVGDDGSCNNTSDDSQIGTSAFNISYNDSKYLGYTYDDNTDSTIKKYIDDWYRTNMIEYTNMLEDTVWCSDRSIYNTVSSDILYGAHNRVSSCNPSIVCVNENDRYTVSSENGNGILTYPVALLTADEAILAGHGNKGYMANGYLNIGNKWWTLSPSNYSFNNKNIYEFSVFSGGYVHFDTTVNKLASVRPSISIVSGTMIREGNGSVTNPYKLVEDKITKEWTFDYTGGEQEFKVPYDGVYKLEVWGASGGIYPGWDSVSGGFSVGNIALEKTQLLYVYVGGAGGAPSSVNGGVGGYNGGGRGGNGKGYSGGSGGGGATHISMKNGLLQNLETEKSGILIVAGGGGGISKSYSGHGGGVIGGNAVSSDCAGKCTPYAVNGGTQTTGYMFGLGQNGISKPSNAWCGAEGNGGGGGGYYGGFASQKIGECSSNGGGAGSGYIGNKLLNNKVMYCYNCEESSEESTKTISTNNVSEEAISNYAKKGNGYAKITLVSKK